MKMSKHKIANRQMLHYGGKIVVATLGIALFAGVPFVGAQLYAAEPTKSKIQKSAASKKLVSTTPTSTKLVNMELSLGQSSLMTGMNLQKVKVDDEKIVQVEVTSPRD